MAAPPERRAPGEAISYLELAALPTAPFWARCHTKAALHAWRQWPETIETAELLVSELVTNAINASGLLMGQLRYSDLMNVERISLTLRHLPGRIVVEVSDNNPNPPVVADAGTDAEDGRGLMLVQALSKEWGHFFPPAGGKRVYCVIGGS
jgi:anti-sigma regulatory factor (Ser/Thr protein kinase)